MHARTLFLVCLLVGTTLAGCLGNVPDDVEEDPLNGILDPALRESLTKPVYELLGHFEERFEGTTGVQLYVDFYRPDTPEDVKTPVILVFTPYQSSQKGESPLADVHDEDVSVGDITVSHDTPYNRALVEYYVPRGYTVAFADVRGNHNAGGCIDQTGPEQWQDGYDYVEWLGTQPWSNGNVGMWGVSYDGETQFTTAMMAPPHLKTIVPIASVSNQYEWSFYNGVPYELQPFIGMFSYFRGSMMPSLNPADAAVYHEKLECQPQQFAAGTDFSGDHTTFWKERDYRGMAKDIEASVLHVHGLTDWNVRPIHIDPLFNDIEAPKRGVFGQWHHATPDREDWQTIVHAWYDHWLLGKQNGIMDILPPVLIEDSTETWHGIDSFPPLGQPWMELELSADGTLTTPGNATAGDLEIVDYPQEVLLDPRFSFTPSTEDLLTTSGAFDAPAALEFTYTTAEELHLVGRPVVHLTLTTDTTSTHWTARLLVDDPSACEYTHRNETYGQRICTNAGYQDTRHRDGFDDPKDLTPNEPYELDLWMYPQYDVIPANSTIRLVLSNNDPEVSQDNTFARSIVHLGDGQALFRLPLAPTNNTGLPANELPEIFPGYLASS